MGVASIDFLAVDTYKKTTARQCTSRKKTTAVHQPQVGREREGEGERLVERGDHWQNSRPSWSCESLRHLRADCTACRLKRMQRKVSRPDDVALALHAGVLEADLQSKRDIVRPNTSDSDTFTQALSRPQQWYTLPQRIVRPVLLLLCESMNLRHPHEDSVVCKGVAWQSCQS